MTTSCDPTGPLLVLTAMPEEASPVTARLAGPRELPTPFTGGVAAVRGTLEGLDTVVVTTGIGVAAATAAATWGILSHRPRAVVAAGSCGGLAPDVEVGTVIVGESFTYSIADATAFGYAPGQLPGGPERFLAEPGWVDAAEQAARKDPGDPGVRRGLMLTGDAFVTAPLAEPMRQRFPAALSADMETTASARTASQLGVPFVALRAVSDLCGPAAGQQFHLEIDLVAEISARAVAGLARGLAE
ncbi:MULTISPECIES: 5'-methylthioadenosine/S-adenosylhomocysteine nucleosidase [unclassified Brachybacterium]|uniref:5'-methylthioadenosine/S-adenosylhomocysteine nucleosidase n=1 Tax=unclassified Brachybacterium TaxID=2623841 RepID=UPI003605BAD8